MYVNIQCFGLSMSLSVIVTMYICLCVWWGKGYILMVVNACMSEFSMHAWSWKLANNLFHVFFSSMRTQLYFSPGPIHFKRNNCTHWPTVPIVDGS